MPQYPAQIDGDGFIVSGDDAHHLSVARAQTGDNLKIFDRSGQKYNAVIKTINKNLVSGLVLGAVPARAPRYALTLCFAPVSRIELEDILDKGTQLGVKAFQPVITARTEHDVIKKWESKKERWESIIMSAVKQCETSSIPAILPPITFELALKTPGQNIMAYEREEINPLSKALGTEENIKLFIGPVGGFTEGEVALAVKYNAQLCTLGPNIMRAETAAIAGAAIILQELK